MHTRSSEPRQSPVLSLLFPATDHINQNHSMPGTVLLTQNASKGLQNNLPLLFDSPGKKTTKIWGDPSASLDRALLCPPGTKDSVLCVLVPGTPGAPSHSSAHPTQNRTMKEIIMDHGEGRLELLHCHPVASELSVSMSGW